MASNLPDQSTRRRSPLLRRGQIHRLGLRSHPRPRGPPATGRRLIPRLHGRSSPLHGDHPCFLQALRLPGFLFYIPARNMARLQGRLLHQRLESETIPDLVCSGNELRSGLSNLDRIHDRLREPLITRLPIGQRPIRNVRLG